MNEEIKQEYWRIRNKAGRPIGQEMWIKHRSKHVPCFSSIVREHGSWVNFRVACGDSEIIMNIQPREPKNIPCNYAGIMIHYTESEYARLQNIKDLKYVETDII